jgi:phosphatidylglycerophosphate synthase
MKHLPVALIYCRLAFSILLVPLALSSVPHKGVILSALIAAGLLSDIFDGIIARRLGVSTETLRRLDSSVDQVFWIASAVTAFIISPDFFRENIIAIIILAGLEAMCYVISYLRFGKEVSTHALASKLWVLTLFATLIEIIATGGSSAIFITCIVLGIITRLEIIGILFVLKQWTHDVPSIYHAVQLRRNKPIKKNKLFNG